MLMSKILLCVSGGIAAYKAIDLASRLHKAGHEIRTVLTQNALRFVSALNFSAITGGSVHSSLFDDADPIPHIHLADWADLIVIAPATANLIAKAAHGLADDLCSTILLAHTKPRLWIPAMNVNMYSHPATEANLATLKARGDHVLEPVTGLLACGYAGKGKYPPNEEVEAAINCYLKYGKDLEGIRVLLTAGAGEEPIDPMRKLTNNSSGKMGIALARALALRGAKVRLVHGRISVTVPYYLEEAVEANDAHTMLEAVMSRRQDADWIIKCAAVSDFTPLNKELSKIPKQTSLQLELISTPDILAMLGSMKAPGQKLIGFAAQTEDLIKNAKAKLKKKRLDMICANLLKTAGQDSTEIVVIKANHSNKNAYAHLSGTKDEVAHAIIDHIKSLDIEKHDRDMELDTHDG